MEIADSVVQAILGVLALLVDAAGVFFTALAAIASSAAIIYVARQTKFVKKSTDAAEDAVRVAEDNAAAARESLELSRATFRQSERARLDARAPRVFAHYDAAAIGKPGTLWWKEKDYPELEWQPASPGMVFDFGEGLTQFFPFRVTVPVTIRNDGPGSAPLTSRGFYQDGDTLNDAVRQVLLPPNSSLHGHVLLTMMLNQWQQFREYDVQPEWGAEFDVIGPFTEDVDDHFVTAFTGSVLEPVEGAEFQWRIASDGGSLEVASQDNRRIYRFGPAE